MAHTIIDNTIHLQTKMKTNVPLALRFIAGAIKSEATPNTPMLAGPLRQNVRINSGGKRASIHWGQRYAQYQERGYTSGPVRRYTTPGTGAHFAENAARKVARGAIKYFRAAGVA